MHEGSRRAVLAALFANMGIAVAKFVGFVITGATSMLAEGVHSVADSSNQGLLLYGGKRSRRVATSAHPFGFGRERYFWSFVVALVIFSLGALFALYEGLEKVTHPHKIETPAVALTILGLASVLEAFSLRTAVRESNRVRGQDKWIGFIRRAKVPELPVVLLEDLGALLGLLLAFAGVGLATITGDPIFDAYGTLGISALLGVIAVALMIEMKSLLIGESATESDEQAIRAAVESDARVNRLIHMRTQHIGPEELLVALKIELVSGLDAPGIAETINAVENEVRARVRAARLIYIEPDIYHDGAHRTAEDELEEPHLEPVVQKARSEPPD